MTRNDFKMGGDECDGREIHQRHPGEVEPKHSRTKDGIGQRFT